AGTQFYNNVGNFFQTGLTQRHNLSVDGGSDALSYYVSGTDQRTNWVVPGTNLNRVNLTGRMTGVATKWLSSDVTMMYGYESNNQPYKGDNSPLIGLLTWPDSNNAQNYLTPAGTRNRITSASAGSEVDNPYFTVNKNKLQAKTNR